MGNLKMKKNAQHTPCCTPACVLGIDYVLASLESDVSSPRTPVY